MKPLVRVVPHEWRPERTGHAYRCRHCGTRCYDPDAVVMDCAAMQTEYNRNRLHAPHAGGYEPRRAP